MLLALLLALLPAIPAAVALDELVGPVLFKLALDRSGESGKGGAPGGDGG